MIRVGICDDDLATREALIRILERRRGFVIAASVSSGEEAVAYRGRVDVWLMDVRMIVRDEMDARLVELVLEGHSAEAMLQMIDLSDSGLKKRLGKLMRRAGVSWLSTTTKSIEEISTTILQEVLPLRLGVGLHG